MVQFLNFYLEFLPVSCSCAEFSHGSEMLTLVYLLYHMMKIRNRWTFDKLDNYNMTDSSRDYDLITSSLPRDNSVSQVV